MSLSSLRFVIIEADEFIAADMAAGLQDVTPDSIIVRLRHPDDVATLPRDSSRVTVLITGDRLEGIDASGLAQFARSIDAEIVVREGLDSNSAVRARGYHSMRTPFTDTALLAVAEAFLANRAA